MNKTQREAAEQTLLEQLDVIRILGAVPADWRRVAKLARQLGLTLLLAQARKELEQAR